LIYWEKNCSLSYIVLAQTVRVHGFWEKMGENAKAQHKSQYFFPPKTLSTLCHFELASIDYVLRSGTVPAQTHGAGSESLSFFGGMFTYVF
jgi:hypothetical protein